MTEELTRTLGTLGADIQSLLTTVQQLCRSLEASRQGKRQAEAEVLRLATVLNLVKSDLDDDAHWITDLAQHKLAVELSPRTREAVAAVLGSTSPASRELRHVAALEHVAECADALVRSSGTEDAPEIIALRDAVRAWRSVARRPE